MLILLRFVSVGVDEPAAALRLGCAFRNRRNPFREAARAPDPAFGGGYSAGPYEGEGLALGAGGEARAEGTRADGGPPGAGGWSITWSRTSLPFRI